MNEKEFLLATKIKKKLEKIKLSLRIDDLFKIANEDEKAVKIRSQIEDNKKNIEELLGYLSKDNKEVKEKLNLLSTLSIEYNSIKSVKKYNNAVMKYNKYIDKLNEELFNIK